MKEVLAGSLMSSSLSSLTNTIFTAADLSSVDTPPDIPASKLSPCI